MALFSLVPVHCNNCGDLFITNFLQYDGRFCCTRCANEFKVRRAASVLGKEYKQKEETAL